MRAALSVSCGAFSSAWGRWGPGPAAAGPARATGRTGPAAPAEASDRAAPCSCRPRQRRGLLGRLAVGAERLVELRLQLAARVELFDDVGAADQLALDEDLGNRRPTRQRRELLPDLRVG